MAGRGEPPDGTKARSLRLELTKLERLFLWNQYEMRKHVDPKSREHCETVQEALQSGYQPCYEYVLDRMEKEEITGEQAQFVYDVLDMFDALQRYEQASGTKIEHAHAKFSGFDGHGDLVGFARFNVEVLKRWDYLNIKNFDAHMPIEPIYQRMLEVWKGKSLSERFTLNPDEVEAIFAATTHQDNRQQEPTQPAS